MKSLDYQITAVQRLVDTSNELLSLQGNHTIIFKAPTGSGKTVMVAEFLKNFVEHRQDYKEFSFIWTAPRKLHSQSKEKLEKHYQDSMALKCSFFEDLSDRMIGPNEILFLNWESINKENNIFYRENEQEFYLEKVIENTKDDGRIIVLIIDESHHSAGADNSKGLISMIGAKLAVEVSATPPLISDKIITVDREYVINEEMIKKRISINPGFKNDILQQMPSGDVKIKSTAEESTNDFVIRNALKKREELSQYYKDEGSEINPLLLIQLPDRRIGQMNIKDEIIDILKDNHDIKVNNDRLAIYLSEDKENLATITKNDSPVEVMIFKQAIALGWDCPRASILVLFRDWRSIIFSIQTVGRIMRMPELKHYSNDDLNIGYVYTNLSDISIHQDIAGSYAVIHQAQRKDNYENINLQSVHSVRQRERTRLSPKFIEHFYKAAQELELKDKINIDVDSISNQLITDGIVTNPDEEFKHLQEEQREAFDSHTAELVSRNLNEEEIQILFDNFSINALSPLHPEERSVKRINKSIYEFFKHDFPLQFQYAGIDEQMIVLSENNRQHFLDVINLAKDNYLAEIEKRSKELETDEIWEIPFSVSYSNEYFERDFKLSILEPFYENKNASSVEQNFAPFLDSKSDEIVWWNKNGERDGTFFAVPYKVKDDNLPFYVDWIVKYKDGRIGLFDTKAGITAETAGPRAEGLAEYIKSENLKGKNLFGGIVIEKGGSFWYNDQEKYEYVESSLNESGWKVLS